MRLIWWVTLEGSERGAPGSYPGTQAAGAAPHLEAIVGPGVSGSWSNRGLSAIEGNVGPRLTVPPSSSRAGASRPPSGPRGRYFKAQWCCHFGLCARDALWAPALVSGLGCRVQGSGFSVQELGFGIWDRSASCLLCTVHCAGCRAQSLGFTVLDCLALG